MESELLEQRRGGRGEGRAQGSRMMEPSLDDGVREGDAGAMMEMEAKTEAAASLETASAGASSPVTVEQAAVVSLRKHVDATHSELYAKAQQATEKYRAMTIPEMVADRGTRLLVIQPGSETLRVGLASAPERAVEVPNCVAYKVSSSGVRGEGRSAKRPRTESTDPSIMDVGCRKIETALGLSRASRKGGKVVGDPTLARREGRPSDVPPRRPDSDSRRCLVGTEALDAAAAGTHELHFCVRAGHLRHDAGATPITTLKQRCLDAWSYCIHDRLRISRDDVAEYSCLLVVSSVMEKREIRDLVDVVLRDLGVREVAVHNESVAAVFTHACPVACVVNVDTEVTTVQCLEDGMCLSGSRLVLPYGRHDVYRLIRGCLSKKDSWPWRSDDVGPGGMAGCGVEEYRALERVHSRCCRFEAEEGPAAATASDGGQPSAPTGELDIAKGGERYRLTPGTAALVPPMGLFYPGAFGHTAEHRRRRCGAHLATCGAEGGLGSSAAFQDSVDGFMLDALVTRDDRFTNVARRAQMVPEHRLCQEMSALETFPGLDHAVVQSILDQEKPELKTRLFQNIVLVGDRTRDLPGCVDALEARVLHAIPQREATVNTVNVVKPKVPASEAVFKGGCLLGMLDFLQENWIQRKEWMNGGVHAGTDETKKLTRMNKLTLQTLWHGVY